MEVGTLGEVITSLLPFAHLEVVWLTLTFLVHASRDVEINNLS